MECGLEADTGLGGSDSGPTTPPIPSDPTMPVSASIPHTQSTSFLGLHLIQQSSHPAPKIIV